MINRSLILSLDLHRLNGCDKTNANNNFNSNNTTPSAISLEFIWANGSTAFWGGQIKAIDLLINHKRLYSIPIPKQDQLCKTTPLIFHDYQYTLGNGNNYLILKNPQTKHFLSLQAGMFREEQRCWKTPHGTPKQEIFLDRTNFALELDVDILQTGKHYKICFSNIKEQINNNDFDYLYAIPKEDGPCQQATTSKNSKSQIIGSNPSNSLSSSETKEPSSNATFLDKKKEKLLAGFNHLLTDHLLNAIKSLRKDSTESSQSPACNWNFFPNDDLKHIKACYLEMIDLIDNDLIEKLCHSDNKQFLIHLLDAAGGEKKLNTLIQYILAKIPPKHSENTIKAQANKITKLLVSITKLSAENPAANPEETMTQRCHSM